MATQRLLNASRGGDTRPADSLVQIISILGARRRELKGSVGERLRRLDARAAAFEARHTELVARLAGLEGRLEHLDRARGMAPASARVHQLGTALLYVGAVLVLWVVLLELGLALGLT